MKKKVKSSLLIIMLMFLDLCAFSDAYTKSAKSRDPNKSKRKVRRTIEAKTFRCCVMQNYFV